MIAALRLSLPSSLKAETETVYDVAPLNLVNVT